MKKTTKAMNQAITQLRNIHTGKWAVDFDLGIDTDDLIQAMERFSGYLAFTGSEVASYVEETFADLLNEGMSREAVWSQVLENQEEDFNHTLDCLQLTEDCRYKVHQACQNYAADVRHQQDMGLTKDEARRLRRQARKAVK